MNIHEHQAKEILKEFGAPVSNGVVIKSVNEIPEKIKKLKSNQFVLKAQIHAGGRGKAGGVKLIKDINELEKEAKEMMGKILVTHQTGPEGRQVKRLYIEEASDISKEFYLSCLIDRETSKIAFISSTEGGMDIEKVASETPNKIITNKIDFKNNGPDQEEIDKIISIFKLNENQKKSASKLVKSLYEITIKKDASLIEINPLVITNSGELICLDAKMTFDDNAIFRRPEILKFRDLNEEDPAEIEASKYDLAYIKLNGSIGCMVNGAGLAMATMDIITSTIFFAASFKSVADNIFKFDFSKISFPSLKFVPANLTTNGTERFISFAASNTPCASTSHLIIPPKIFINIPFTF